MGHSLVQVQLSMLRFPFPVHHSLLSTLSSLCPPPHTQLSMLCQFSLCSCPALPTLPPHFNHSCLESS